METKTKKEWYSLEILLTWQMLLRLLTALLAIGLLYSVIMFIATTPEIVAEYGYQGYTPLLIGGTFSLYIAAFFLKAVYKKKEFKIT